MDQRRQGSARSQRTLWSHLTSLRFTEAAINALILGPPELVNTARQVGPGALDLAVVASRAWDTVGVRTLSPGFLGA